MTHFALDTFYLGTHFRRDMFVSITIRPNGMTVNGQMTFVTTFELDL